VRNASAGHAGKTRHLGGQGPLDVSTQRRCTEVPTLSAAWRVSSSRTGVTSTNEFATMPPGTASAKCGAPPPPILIAAPITAHRVCNPDAWGFP
jgi:hypothetical protein